MNGETESYIAGRDVTEKFRGARKESVVLSVRMSIDEMKRLEALSQETGKTIAQVVRESVASYQPISLQQPVVLTIGTSEGGEFRWGPPQPTEVAGLVSSEEPIVSD